MATTVIILPPDTNAALLKRYEQAVAYRRRVTVLVGLGLAFCVYIASITAEVDLTKFWTGLPRFFSYFYDIIPSIKLSTFSFDVASWYWNWDGWLTLLFETVIVAYIGTSLGAIFGFCLAFFASRNLNSHIWSQVVVRRVLEFLRTVPDIVFALLLVYALGLGPISGVLAIALHTTGALGKLFSEINENIDTKPIEGVKATGASWFETIRFAVIPQVLSNFVSYTLLRFEINVRGAAVMGFVGAGGIGKELLASIRQFYYSDVSAILLMIILTVILIDLFTERLRHRFLSLDGHL